MKCQNDLIENILFHQLNSFWPTSDKDIIISCIPDTLEIIKQNFELVINKRFNINNEVFFSPFNTVQWMIFLYRLSRCIFLKFGNVLAADQIYYLNKILHGIDWFYSIDLPIHFCCEHPLGSVLGKAKYSDFLFVYQGTTVGGNIKKEKIYYPKIGKNVVLFANSSILGNSIIGDNVIISAGCQVINENVQSNMPKILRN